MDPRVRAQLCSDPSICPQPLLVTLLVTVPALSGAEDRRVGGAETTDARPMPGGVVQSTLLSQLSFLCAHVCLMQMTVGEALDHKFVVSDTDMESQVPPDSSAGHAITNGLRPSP